MGTLKLKRLLGSKKPLRGILDAVTRVQTGVFWIESPEGKALYGEVGEGGNVHDLCHEDVVVGRLCSKDPVDDVLHIVRGFIQLEAEKRDITSEVLERYRELSLLYELAERLTEVLHKAVPSLNEEQGEEIGIFMAKNRDVFAKAFKNQPDALDELEAEAASE